MNINKLQNNIFHIFETYNFLDEKFFSIYIVILLNIKRILSSPGKPNSYMFSELRGAIEQQTDYFSLRHIRAATNNFDRANMIGEGGFGPVYKVICF